MSGHITCTRVLEFDAAHRVTTHGSKCRNLHGHRYRAEITCSGTVGEQGFVLDFGKIKEIVGGWIDTYWDHGAILRSPEDDALVNTCIDNDWKVFTLPVEPSAENMSAYLLTIATGLLAPHGVKVEQVRLYETPNSWADAT